MSTLHDDVAESLRVRLESQFLDAGPWAKAYARFIRFRSEVKKLATSPAYKSSVESDEVYIDSPDREVPMTILVRLTLRGPSWVVIRDIADRLISEAAQQADIQISDDDSAAAPDGVYEVGDLELVGA